VDVFQKECLIESSVIVSGNNGKASGESSRAVSLWNGLIQKWGSVESKDGVGGSVSIQTTLPRI